MTVVQVVESVFGVGALALLLMIGYRLWVASREPLFPLFEEHRREREGAAREPFVFPFAPPAYLARVKRLKDVA